MATLASGDPETLSALADEALDRGTEETVEPVLAAWLERNGPDARLLHWHALLLRALDRHDEALANLEQARRLSPTDAGIAHSFAQVALEAGGRASAHFESAIRIAPTNPELRHGLFAARYAEGEGSRALDELEAMLTANPGWYAGHRQFAQLSAMLGRAERALASIEHALARFPEAGALYLLGLELLIEAERYQEALALADRAIARLGEEAQLVLSRAVALDELGRHGEAGALLTRLGPADDSGHAIRRLRHLLRTGAATAAAAELEPWLARAEREQFWPYAALTWQLIGDPRLDWLEGQEGLIGLQELDGGALNMPALAACLRRLHARSGRFLNQSVRGGTQTDGPLFARTEPEIRNVREVLRAALAAHVAALPGPDPAHPQLRLPRDQSVRFSGAWSVRLCDAGHHASHHHPQGWFSAVFYVAVPKELAGEEGRLVLGGSPADLDLPVPARRLVEPSPGRLVIFPSTMWHATLPFSEGERMTIAFDIARPYTGVRA